MDDIGNSKLGNPETPGNIENQLLQGTKGTQPATIHTASPQQQCQRHKPPQDKYQGVDQEDFPGELVQQGADKGQHMND